MAVILVQDGFLARDDPPGCHDCLITAVMGGGRYWRMSISNQLTLGAFRRVNLGSARATDD